MAQVLSNKKSTLDKWFKGEEKSGYDTSALTQEELIKRIRKERDKLWDESHTEWFEGREKV